MKQKKIYRLVSFIMVASLTSYAVLCSAATAPNQIKQTQELSASGVPIAALASPHFYADKWYRDSAERNAIYREVFLLGEEQIKQRVKNQHLKPHQWGVIFDIDETTLDNSLWAYQHDVKTSKQSWNAFASQAQSIALPGIVKLTHDIHQMGGYVTMISNRSNILLPATRKNLINQHVYFDQVLLDTTNVGTSLVDKNPRFNAVVSGQSPSKLPAQKVIAWFGDNIQDFPNLWQKQMIQKNPNGEAFAKFGVTYFALPNPMYGSWELNKFK